MKALFASLSMSPRCLRGYVWHLVATVTVGILGATAMLNSTVVKRLNKWHEKNRIFHFSFFGLSGNTSIPKIPKSIFLWMVLREKKCETFWSVGCGERSRSYESSSRRACGDSDVLCAMDPLCSAGTFKSDLRRLER